MVLSAPLSVRMTETHVSTEWLDGTQAVIFSSDGSTLILTPMSITV
jgi:hypothetical protein